MTRPGLQPERTDLAWRRTSLTAAGCSLLLLDVAVRNHVTPIPAIVTGVAAVLLAVLGSRSANPPNAARPRVLALISLLVTAAALTSIWLAV